jgi:hypothetical protein
LLEQHQATPCRLLATAETDRELLFEALSLP